MIQGTTNMKWERQKVGFARHLNGTYRIGGKGKVSPFYKFPINCTRYFWGQMLNPSSILASIDHNSRLFVECQMDSRAFARPMAAVPPEKPAKISGFRENPISSSYLTFRSQFLR